MRFTLLLIPLLLLACTSIPTAVERRQSADTLAAGRDWRSIRIPSERFELVAYVPRRMAPAERLTVYIEGDGLAWVNASTPSSDPTPRDPLGLRLALAHPDGNAAYLGRPCQYLDTQVSACAQAYWTESRFAPEVIEAMSDGLSQLKARFAAKRLTLVGYSGGAAVAALLAARRGDVERLVTVAGNLDHRAWTMHHHVAPLSGSLNAHDASGQLSVVPQTHFVGGRDRVIPPVLAFAWGEGLLGPENRNLRLLPDFDHQCCWAKQWRELWIQQE